MGQVKRAPAWNPSREQTNLEILRRDWLIRDRMACNSVSWSRKTGQGAKVYSTG